MFTIQVIPSPKGDNHLIAQLFDDGHFREWMDCKYDALEYAEAEAAMAWPFAASVNGMPVCSQGYEDRLEEEGGVA